MTSGLLLVLIAALLILFSVQNVGNVAVYFLSWRFEAPVATVMAVAVLTGIIITQLLRRVMAKRREQARNTIEFISRRRI